ncbi:MAG: ABC transporter ATP-binding protein, partial [Bacteroidales bacterium]
YYGDLLAVDNLSLQVRKGEVFGFLGPNGAGKTTSIRMMCGLLRPTSGEVLINGERISNAGIRSHNLRVGICPQEIILWNKLTCYEQLVFMGRMYDVPGKTARDRADLLLDRIGLREKRNKLVSTLSGGMKRRLNVIMAIIHEPEIVVFDEPEAGLDPQSRIMVRDFIQQTSEEKTVIFTTHNMDEAERISDRVAIIDRGKLLQLDTPEHLKKSIGKGDVLELRIQVTNDKSYDIVADKLRENKFDLMISEERWIIKAMDLVPKIHMIYKILDQEGIQVSSMNMRENTLEDVFIHLTGRRLRQ